MSELDGGSHSLRQWWWSSTTRMRAVPAVGLIVLATTGAYTVWPESDNGTRQERSGGSASTIAASTSDTPRPDGPHLSPAPLPPPPPPPPRPPTPTTTEEPEPTETTAETGHSETFTYSTTAEPTRDTRPLVTEGESCDDPGAVGRDSSGREMSCTYVWYYPEPYPRLEWYPS